MNQVVIFAKKATTVNSNLLQEQLVLQVITYLTRVLTPLASVSHAHKDSIANLKQWLTLTVTVMQATSVSKVRSLQLRIDVLMTITVLQALLL